MDQTGPGAADRPALAPLTERFRARNRPGRFPAAEYLARHTVLLHHSAFLGPEGDMADLARALAKLAARARRGRD